MSLTCLSRTLDPADYTALAPQLAFVDYAAPGQREPRRWAYALAIHAIERWMESGRVLSDTLYDIGGGMFRPIVSHWTGREPVGVDDVFVEMSLGGTPLADIITAFEVIDKVLDPERLLYGASCLLAPGGLLVLTFAYRIHCGADTAVGHETRRRIYCPKDLAVLRLQAATCLLQPFGGTDPTWHGPQVHDHTIASLVLEKKR